MASNQTTLPNVSENEETLLTGVNENVYEDQSIGAELTKKDINRVAWRSMLLQASFNYERMQASGWLYGLLPALKKIHTNKRDLARAMKGHMGFFNTHPFLVTFVIGIIIFHRNTHRFQFSNDTCYLLINLLQHLRILINRHDNHLYRSQMRRQYKSVIIRVSHDQCSHQTGRYPP